MTYREHIREAMRTLDKEPKLRFMGYNVRYGRAAGSLETVDESKLIEMPLSENLMIGAAIGMSLEGFIPLVYFERMDFLLCAMDALVNHLDKLSELSGGIHRPGVIIRCVVGNKKVPLFTGATHTQDLSVAVKEMVHFPVQMLHWKSMIQGSYEAALRAARKGNSTMLVEYKDLWESE